MGKLHFSGIAVLKIICIMLHLHIALLPHFSKTSDFFCTVVK